MKTNRIVICVLLGIIYMACEDSVGRVGLGMQPEGDKISVFDTTVIIEARTIEVDSVYAKTANGFLGELYDPTYGTIKSSCMCQYYPSIGFPYLDSIVDNKIDSVRLNVYYSSYIGDTLAPMEVTVYPVVKPLDKNYYTNADPGEYCDLSRPIAKYGYTARNKNMSDSLMQAWRTNTGYYSYISIPLPVKIGQDYLDKVMNGELNTLDEFLGFFPGTYLTTTFGTGNLLPIDYMEIAVYYTLITTLQDQAGSDSIVTSPQRAAFTVTKEIIQLNKFENKNPAFLTEDNSDKTFIKSPAGVFTELTIPIKKIVEGIGKKKFSSVKLSLNVYPQDDRAYPLPFPGMTNSMLPKVASTDNTGYSAKMLLIEPDSVTNFFEMKKIADNQTSYATQFNPTTYTYDFNNIANLVQNAIEKVPDKDLKLWLIPVQTTWVLQKTSTSTYQVDYMTSHYLYPSGVTLKKGGDNLKVRVIATDLAINN